MNYKTETVLPSPQIHLWYNFHEDPFSSFYIKLLTERQTNLPGRCNQSINLSIEQTSKQLINIIVIIKSLTKQLTDCNQHKKTMVKS